MKKAPVIICFFIIRSYLLSSSVTSHNFLENAQPAPKVVLVKHDKAGIPSYQNRGKLLFAPSSFTEKRYFNSYFAIGT